MTKTAWRLAIVKGNDNSLFFLCKNCESYSVFASERSLYYSRFWNMVFTVGEPHGCWGMDEKRENIFIDAIDKSNGMIRDFDPGFLRCPQCDETIPQSDYGSLGGPSLLYHVFFDDELSYEYYDIVMPPNHEWREGIQRITAEKKSKLSEVFGSKKKRKR